MVIDVILIGILILLNGFFAASEMALVTARRTRLKMIEKAGDQRAAKVLDVQDNPGNFLAMVQIGITLVGTTAAAVRRGGGNKGLDESPLFVSQVHVFNDGIFGLKKIGKKRYDVELVERNWSGESHCLS